MFSVFNRMFDGLQILSNTTKYDQTRSNSTKQGVQTVKCLVTKLFDGVWLANISRFSRPLGKNTSIRSTLPTVVCWSREKREEGVKLICFSSKVTSAPQANHSQYSSPVEALNLIVESKSLPAEVNHLNIELRLPIEAKEKLAILLFCGF